VVMLLRKIFQNIILMMSLSNKMERIWLRFNPSYCHYINSYV